MPFCSNCAARQRRSPYAKVTLEASYLLFRTWCRCLDSIATLYYVGLEGNRSRAAMELKEQTAGVAEDRTALVASP